MEKYFTDQSIADKYSGLIDQAISNILKLELGFNYNLDHYKHINNIINDFLTPVWVAIKKDKTSKGAPAVIRRYEKTRELIKLANSIKKDFRDNYGYTGTIMLSDIDDALDTILVTLYKSSREEMRAYLFNRYK